MRRVSAQLLSPALVLKALREVGPVTAANLGAFLRIGCGSIDRAANARMESILEGLAEARLIRLQNGRILTTPLLATLQRSLELSLSELAARHNAVAGDDAKDLVRLLPLVRAAAAGTPFSEDLQRSLDELAETLRARCYIAVMCLAGKVLEMCLKLILERSGVRFEDKDGIGTLVGKLRSEKAAVYVDPGLGQVADIVRQARNPAIHASSDIPVPSREQALMVLQATLDILRRTFNLRAEPEGGCS